jgi:nitroreductase
MDALELLLSRSSAARLTAPAPSDGAVEQMIGSAIRAPDHGRLRPWKFVVIREHMRARFGDVLAEATRRRMPETTPEALQREREKAMRAPMIVIVVFTPKASANIPVVEQMLSAGAAAQNIMLAAHALGYGAMWRTGGAAYDEDVKRALGLNPGDSIVGFLHIGIRLEGPAPKRLPPREDPQQFMVEWLG